MPVIIPVDPPQQPSSPAVYGFPAPTRGTRAYCEEPAFPDSLLATVLRWLSLHGRPVPETGRDEVGSSLDASEGANDDYAGGY